MKNAITKEHIDNIMSQMKTETFVTFNKNLIVSVQLPSGFVITESSACVDPENFNFGIGYDICMNRIENKIWELEGYRLQSELAV